MSERTDWPWEYGRESAAHQWLVLRLRELAEHYAPPEPGLPGYEVEGRVIASDLIALVETIERGLS